MKNKSLTKNSIYFILYRLINVIYPLITATYVSRVLKPSGVGEFSVAQTVVAFLVACALLGIPNYGVREISKTKDRKELNILFSELFFTNLISTLIISFIYYNCVNFIPFGINKTLFNIQGIILLLNIINVDWFYQGKEEFKYITIRSCIVKLVSIIFIFIFVNDVNDICTYSIIFVGAYVGNYLFNVFNLRKYVSLTLRGISLKKHLKYILILAITYISNEIYVTIDSVMLRTMTNSSQVGYYSNAMKLMKILINVCTAMGTAMLPRLSKLKFENDDLKFNEIINKGLKILLWITIPCTLGIMCISKNIIIVLFGNEFEPASGILSVLSLLAVFRSFSNLFLQILLCVNEEKKMTIAYFSGAILNIILNYILIKKFLAIGAAIASVISELYILILLFNFSKKNYKIDINIKFIFSIIISNIIMYICAFIIKSININIVLSLFISISISVFIYIVCSLITKNDALMFVLNKIMKRR